MIQSRTKDAVAAVTDPSLRAITVPDRGHFVCSTPILYRHTVPNVRVFVNGHKDYMINGLT